MRSDSATTALIRGKFSPAQAGTPWIWLNAGGLALCLLALLGLLALISSRGLPHFWPSDLLQAQLSAPGVRAESSTSRRIIVQPIREEQVATRQLREAGIAVPDDAPPQLTRILMHGANHDLTPHDYFWVLQSQLSAPTHPAALAVFERLQWGDLYGYLLGIREDKRTILHSDSADDARAQIQLWKEFALRHERALRLQQEIAQVETEHNAGVNRQLAQLRLREQVLRQQITVRTVDASQATGRKHPDYRAELAALEQQRSALEVQYRQSRLHLDHLQQRLQRDRFTVEVADGRQLEFAFADLVRAYRPNALGTLAKLHLYGVKLWEFLSQGPREDNTEGGVFPALFGTLLMVMLTAALVTPFGVLAAIYLHEYAHQSRLTRLIRIAVSNLAGVPSIVYGIFGLGFFVYFLGGNIDALFFRETLPSPTFGTGGLLWASATLALLTLPVVIVATEEGLSSVPRSLREGTLALGATRAETLWRVVLPMASPAMMTGLILAISRAAGEVAPLMLVGVAKLVPELPVDQNFPFVHLEQKFMHLGFHIYDVGFQSANNEAAQPVVYATALLLLLLVLVLNLSAILLRNHLRKRFKTLETNL